MKMKHKMKKGHLFVDGKDLGYIKSFDFELENNLKITYKMCVRKQRYTMVILMQSSLWQRIKEWWNIKKK